MAHKYAWLSFVLYIIGFAFIIASIAVDSLYKLSASAGGISITIYIGSFSLQTPLCQIGSSPQFTCFIKIKSDCSTTDADPITDKCSEFNTMRAFQLMGLIFGTAALFIHSLTLILSKTSGWRRLGSLLLGEITTACMIISMITATSQKDHLKATNYSREYHASFALIIISWIFTGLSSFALFLFNGSKYSESKSSDSVEFN